MEAILNTVPVGKYYATVLDTVDKFNNVVDTTPGYKWMMWERQVDKDTFRPMFILLRFKPTYVEISDLRKAQPSDRFWYATFSEIILEGKKDVTYRD